MAGIFRSYCRSVCGRAASALLLLIVVVGESRALGPAVDAVNADYIWQQGYTGERVEIGVIDLHQVDSSHPALGGNFLGSVNFAKGAGWLSSHATAVAGAALSQDPTRLGVAHGASYWSGQTTNRAGIVPDPEAMTVSVETFAQGLGILGGNPTEVVTMSIGFNGSDDGNDQWSLALDHVVSTLGTTVVVAAGNDGPSPSSYPGPPGAAYNILSVGATGGSGAALSEDYTQIAPYSSRGPTSDGRSKPDIVAPGSLIELPTLSGAWAETSGTSFAAPIVAGGAALLIDVGLDRGYDTDATVIKSVLLNSADKLPGWSHTQTAPLDPNLGAGQMDLAAAFLQYDAGEQEAGTVAPTGWDHGLLSAASSSYAISAAIPIGEQVTATLTWNRQVATDVEDITAAVYSAAPLENLDLFLFEADDLLNPVASSMSRDRQRRAPLLHDAQPGQLRARSARRGRCAA
ncbi:MAG: S8 family serine peptidase [Pirellulales bacterium]